MQAPLKPITGPAFFNNKTFSHAVARQAVGTASKGNYPFGDRIASETQGAVNPHAIASTVVTDLPGLGVCYDGKVALRKNVGIGVARHELAHAMGGDEVTADQAMSNPDVLRSLAGSAGAPVNGWKIGFEFQTSGPMNPKVKALDEKKEETDPNQEEKTELDTSQAAPTQPLSGDKDVIVDYGKWKIEYDGHDIEVVTEAVDETEDGNKDLIEMMESIDKKMEEIQKQGAEPAGWKSPGEPPKFQINHQCGTSIFSGRPQVTMGVRFRAIPDLIHELTNERKEGSEWKEGQLGWEGQHPSFGKKDSDHGQAALLLVRENVAKALQVHLNEDSTIKEGAIYMLRALLNVLGSYIVMSRIQWRSTKYAKNLSPYMPRDNLVLIYNNMPKKTQTIYKAMLDKDGPGSMASALGCSSNNELMALKVLPRGIKPDKNQPATEVSLTYGDVLKGLMNRKDAFRDIDKTIHEYERFERKLPGSPFRIDDSAEYGQAKPRTGMLMELRALRYLVPWKEWTPLALTAFSTLKRLNAVKDSVKTDQADLVQHSETIVAGDSER